MLCTFLWIDGREDDGGRYLGRDEVSNTRLPLYARIPFSRLPSHRLRSRSCNLLARSSYCGSASFYLSPPPFSKPLFPFHLTSSRTLTTILYSFWFINGASFPSNVSFLIPEPIANEGGGSLRLDFSSPDDGGCFTGRPYGQSRQRIQRHLHNAPSCVQ